MQRAHALPGYCPGCYGEELESRRWKVAELGRLMREAEALGRVEEIPWRVEMLRRAEDDERRLVELYGDCDGGFGL